MGPKTKRSNSPDLHYCPLVQCSIVQTGTTTSVPTAIPAGNVNRPTFYSNLYTHKPNQWSLNLGIWSDLQMTNIFSDFSKARPPWSAIALIKHNKESQVQNKLKWCQFTLARYSLPTQPARKFPTTQQTLWEWSVKCFVVVVFSCDSIPDRYMN